MTGFIHVMIKKESNLYLVYARIHLYISVIHFLSFQYRAAATSGGDEDISERIARRRKEREERMAKL